MSSRRKITITPDDKIMVIRGYKVADIARSSGLRPTYSASAGGWMLDVHRLPEFVALLEYRNVSYEIEDGDGPLDVDHPDNEVGVDDVELDLFGQVVV